MLQGCKPLSKGAPVQVKPPALNPMDLALAHPAISPAQKLIMRQNKKKRQEGMCYKHTTQQAIGIAVQVMPLVSNPTDLAPSHPATCFRQLIVQQNTREMQEKLWHKHPPRSNWCSRPEITTCFEANGHRTLTSCNSC